jgi:uncharacterized membrane protein
MEIPVCMVDAMHERIPGNGRWGWFQNTIDKTGRLFSSWPLVTLLLGVAASTIIKLIRLNARELWLDESRSAFFATLPFHDLVRYCIGDTAPPLYHVLLWLWVRLNLIKSAPVDLRMFSVVLSVLGVLGMFILARTWLSTRTAGVLIVGREPSDATPVRKHAAAHGGSAAASRIGLASG